MATRTIECVMHTKVSMNTILILDDNKDILKALKVGLQGCLNECTILTAANGDAGNKIMKTTQVDMIITDLDMPVVNGYRFIEEARSEHPSVPVCVMAGNCSPEVRERLDRMGVGKVIEKPFHFENLASLITEMLGRKQNSQWSEGPVQA